MKSITQFVSSYRRMFLVGIVAVAVVAFSGPGKTLAEKTESPAAVHDVIIVSTSGAAGTQVFVDVELVSGGDEVAGGFSLNFDPTKLSISNISSPGNNPDVTLGSGVPAGLSRTVNANQVASGRIGLLFDGDNQFTASPPNRQIARFRFTILPGAAGGSTPITFGNVPAAQSFSDGLANTIQMTWINGSINIQAAAPPVTVSGRVTVPGGAGLRNAIVTLTDTNNVRRTATTSTFGYYTFTNVPAGPTYTAAVASRRYQFTPITQAITADLLNLDFAGTGGDQ